MKNKTYSQKLTAPSRAPEAGTIKAYPLETIMALQKALEAGLEPKENVAPAQSRDEQGKTPVQRDASSVFIQYFWKPVINGIRRLEQRLKLVLTRKKRSRLTSAR